MLRGYIRVRPKGPSVDEQRRALLEAGVPTDRIYIDKRTRNPLPQRALAISFLRTGDALVIYDAAALGTTTADIMGSLAEIGQHHALVATCNPPGEFIQWIPAVSDALTFISTAGKTLAREWAKVRVGSSPIMGRPRKLTGDVLAYARELWGRRDMSSRKIAAEIKATTGVDVSVRTLIVTLGHKTEAVEKAERRAKRRTVKEKTREPMA
jgi:hypothetical protein